ncbi:MAG: hypothetical protein R3279_02275, partial [Putridiphycobacter sp.]|nr:hypothetical protein [Putridiphycobacter sp.]
MPSFVLNLIKKYSMMVLAFTLARIFFYIFNKSQLVSATLIDFILGIWFDCITTAILFLPLMLMEIVPQKWRLKSWHQTASKLLYFIILTPSLLINIADIEYFKYTSTRSTFSTFKMLSYGSDFTNQLPSFLKDYWFLLCLLILILFAVNWLYNKWIKPPASTLKLSTQLVSVAILMICLLSVGRGWGLRPISPLHASQYTEDQNAPLVLNSAFTILKSAGKQVIDEKTFFDEKAIKSYFNPVKHYHSGAELNQPNVVILMLESFSVEYISGINGDSVSYTPFLDSLIGEGLVFINAFANGKKSIDAVPSVISSIPKLMPEEFIT